jgi:hypothetical protein
MLLPIRIYLLSPDLFLTALYDIFIGALMLISGLVSKSGLAPRSNRTGTTDGGFTLTTTVGVITGVHYRTANCGTPTHVTLAAGLTVVNVCVLRIGYLTYGCHALFGYVTKLTGGKAEKSHSVLTSHELSHVTSGTCKLCALTGVELYVVNNGTNGDVYEGKCVTGLNVGIRSADYSIAYRKTDRSDNVALYAILILNEGDECRTVRIVFLGENGCGDSETVSLEIDNSVLSSVTAATMTNGDSTVAVATGILTEVLEQALFRLYFAKTLIISNGHITS